MAKVSQMQLEASAHQQKAAELESKLNSALQEGENSRQLLVAQETQLEGSFIDLLMYLVLV